MQLVFKSALRHLCIVPVPYRALCNTSFFAICFSLAAGTQLRFGVHIWASHIASHISRLCIQHLQQVPGFWTPCQNWPLKAAARLSARIFPIAKHPICPNLLHSGLLQVQSCSHQNTISTTKTGPHLLIKISMHLECLLAITVPAKVQSTLYSCELLRWHSPCQGLQAQKASTIKELMCCSILLLLPAVCTVSHCFTPKLLTLLRPSAAANTTTEVTPEGQRSSHITWSPVLQA